jgi:multicomponent Na+:H+ antiporter subunit D
MLLFDSGIEAARFYVLFLIGVASILTMVYTIRAFGRIWWQQPAEGIQTKPAGDRLLAPSILIGLVLVFGLWAEPLVQVAHDTSLWLGNPAAYIQAVLGG